MKKKVLSFMFLFLLVAVAYIFVSNTYAKYTASVSKSGKAVVAKWNFQSDNESSTFDIDLKENYDESTLTSVRSIDGKDIKIIAPGTEGSFDIELVNSSEVGVNFTVSLDSIENLPENVKFYKDANYQTELRPLEDAITGQLAALDTEGLTVKVYWKWAYETGSVTDGVATGDSSDNLAGEAGRELTIPVTVKGVQVSPSVGAITSHIN